MGNKSISKQTSDKVRFIAFIIPAFAEAYKKLRGIISGMTGGMPKMFFGFGKSVTFSKSSRRF